MIFCPELIAEYEEKMADFEIKDAKLRALFDALIQIGMDEPEADCDKVLECLQKAGQEKEVEVLWEFKMLRLQKTPILKLREEINTKIAEVQLKMLEQEMKECLKEIDNAPAFPDEVFKRYESLKKEKEAILNEAVPG